MKRNQFLSYHERALLCHHPIAKHLLQLLEAKQTNLAIAADVCKKEELLTLADQLGPHICVLKMHIDIIEDFDHDLIQQLQHLAQKHQFLIFEDRKFADIGQTVQSQYQNGIYKISQWAHLTNAHPLPGPGIIQGLKEIGLPLERGLLLLAEMSSSGALTTESYVQASVKMALEHCDFVIGFIAQKKLLDEPRFIYLTPGVHLQEKGDSLGQQYNSPEKVISHQKCDIMIVGRAIIHSQNPEKVAMMYREAGWKAYLSRIKLRN